MFERNVNQRLILIGVVLLFGVLMLWPPQTKLRPGLDIAGGFSMIFEIDDTGLENYPNLAEEMKTLLQRRVDPKGVSNIVWRVHGRNRIEVQMPLPPEEAKKLQAQYVELERELFAHNIRRSELNEAFSKQGAEREAAVAALANRSDAPQELFDEALRRFDDYQAALTELNDARQGAAATAPADGQAASKPAEVAELELKVRDAQELLDDAYSAILATNLDERRFRDALELDKGSNVRENLLKGFKQSHPKLATKIDEVVAAHQAWREKRGFLDGPADLKRLLHGAGVLEFRILAEPSADNPTQFDRYREQLEKFGPRPQPGDTAQWFRIDDPIQFFNLDSPAQLERFDPLSQGIIAQKHGDEWYVLARVGADSELLGDAQRSWQLERAGTDRDENGRPCVVFQFDPYGGDLFRALTSKNVEKKLCVFVDGVAYSAATIQEAIGQTGRITGDFGREKINYLVSTMQAGALPARLKETPISERIIESSLGADNLRRALRAGLIGGAITLLLVAGYYLVCGMIANVCLLMNLFLLLAAMAMLGARFTLDGVAGVLLAVGMAVDANVLIFERMREEKERGSSLRMIIKNGYDKALSTILDSNITTLLTSVIIYYVGSEEIKGFGLTLGWGIVLNLFTAVFVSRTLFALLMKYRLIKDLRMFSLIGVPNIDWMAKAKYFIPASVVISVVGLGLLAARGEEALDVEFLGGVSAEVEVVQGASVTELQLRQKMEQVGQQIAADAEKLTQATVTPVPGVPGVFEVRAPGVSPGRLAALISEPLEERTITVGPEGTEQPFLRSQVVPSDGGQGVELSVPVGVTAEQVQSVIRGMAGSGAQAGRNLAKASVSRVREVDEETDRYWSFTTTVANRRLVQDALVSALGDVLVVQPRVNYMFSGRNDLPYPILDRRLDMVVPGVPAGTPGDLIDFQGGAAIHLSSVNPPQATQVVADRLRNMRLQPGYQDYPWRNFEVFGVSPVDANGDGQPDTDSQGRTLYSDLVVAVVDSNYLYNEDPEGWATRFAEKELALVRATLDSEQTLRKVSQFKPQVADQSKTQAVLALVLSWAMIIGYMWLRFGQPRYGVAGVIALIHDVIIALAFVGISGWIGGTGHPIGQFFLIEDFKIDMTIVAAFLTIIGYSVNDTIVVFDRIRETRGRLGIVTADVINRSINQTLSRTLLTSSTTFVMLICMYIWGGTAIRGFNYCMIIGIATGTYSSIAIASPMLLLHALYQRTAGRVPRPATA